MDPHVSPVPDSEGLDHDIEFHTRKKRCKYIAKACNECKRRKIRCNGETPCHRCGRQRIGCVYADNPRPSSDNEQNFQRLFDQMTAMQNQISVLSATVHSLTSGDTSAMQRPDSVSQPATDQRPFRRRSSAKEITFQGPTTFAFSFDLAKSSLQQRGIVERNEVATGDMPQEPSPIPSPPLPANELEPARQEDPLWSIGREEALRLCRVYEDEMGIMYPVLELPQLLHQVHLLYDPIRSVLRPLHSLDGSENVDGLDSTDIHILRLVFACALTAEGSGRSELAMRLVASVREVADNCVWGSPEIKNIIFLTLLAIFYFQMDEETLAWRTIGIVERMCLEKGLHRRETLSHPAVVAAGRDRVLRLFWSIYVLDMRWSFGTGMPFSLEDSDIDPWLPEPEEKTPYLRVMIRYSRIAAKVWKFISAFNNSNEIKKDDVHYLDWQVLRWVDAIPGGLRLDQPNSSDSAYETRSIRRLRCLLYLRANQLRMLIHRPVLHTAAHIVRYPSESATVVDIAKETIRFITRLNETSDIYQMQQVTFNWFLVSALAVLFLAVAQAPSEFNNHCREEFYMALELVRGFSTQSYISRRLWKSIRSLRKLAPQLGLQKQRHGEPVPSGGSDAGEISGVTANPLDQATSSSVQSHTPRDGEQMTQELMEWFEAVGNLENQIMGMGAQPVEEPTLGPLGSKSTDGGYMFDYGGELSSVMKDWF